jgi:hypothetical protein
LGSGGVKAERWVGGMVEGWVEGRRRVRVGRVEGWVEGWLE